MAMTVADKETAKEWFKLIEDGVPEDLALAWLEREATHSDAPQEYKDAWKAAIAIDTSRIKLITKVEFIVLRMYTMDKYKFYKKFNSDCRKRNWKCYQVYTSLLQSGLYKLRRKSSDDVRQLYKGLSCKSPDEVANELCMASFTSATASLQMAETFGNNIVFLESKTGPDISKFSEFDEQETLFSPFQVFVALADKSSLLFKTDIANTLPFLLFPLFRGALLGSVAGNCIGAPFEFRKELVTVETLLKKLTEDENKAASKGQWQFTSDTSMILALADCLVKSRPLDIRVLSKSLSDAFIRDGNRKFGVSAAIILEELHRQTPTDDPFAPAMKVYGGSGSYGNGGAMRIVPAGLLNWNDTDDSFKNKIGEITRLTHSNISGVNGAILQARAVQEAIMFSIYQERDETIRERFVDQLIKKMEAVETPDNRPYSDKLKIIKGFLSSKPPSMETIRRELGKGVSAETSVSTAIYCFLRGMLPIKGIPEDRTEFERTIIYAVSLGGDTDTIASMAGAIAGAYYGQDSISQRWRDICEAKAIEDAKRYAKEIHSLVFSTN